MGHHNVGPARSAGRACAFGRASKAVPYSLEIPAVAPLSILGFWNLVSLCKHHHRVKHNAGWALQMSREGRCVWTDPHGRQYATQPVNHHDLAA